MAEANRSVGTVKWFSGQKGFGFIAPDRGGDDLFVHQTEIRADGFRTLREGQRVEYVVDSAEDGRSKAVEVVGLAVRGRGGGQGRGGGRRGSGGRGGGYGRFGVGGGYGRGGRRGGRSSGGYSESGGAECFNCGRIGHLARDCYHGTGGVGSGGGGNRGYGNRVYVGGRNGSGRGGGEGGRLCYNCGKEGHLARDCVNDQN